MSAHRVPGFRLGLFLGTGLASVFTEHSNFTPPGVWSARGTIKMDCEDCESLGRRHTDAALRSDGHFYCVSGEHVWPMTEVVDTCPKEGCGQDARLERRPGMGIVLHCRSGDIMPVPPG
jgi:hypothetical protein